MNKTSHSFVCRDDVWERVEALAKHRGVSTDEVVQAALVQLFVRKRKPPQPDRSHAGSSMTATLVSAPIGADASASRSMSNGSPIRVEATEPPLYLRCDGHWYLIDKAEFVIGRGKKYSDLAIKDANISRRHCAIQFSEGRYFIRDLGSTNGIEKKGERVQSHEITEASVFHLCSHELRFSFIEPRGPVIRSEV